LKALLRSGAVQAFLGAVLGAYIRVIYVTVRWRHENVESVEAALGPESGSLVLFWHGRVTMCWAMFRQFLHRRPKALVSPSADGEFIARALGVLCPSIRMSTAKPGDSAKARQAVAAFREAIAWVASGGSLIVTPDGPRGPNEVIAPGVVQIARRSGRPVFLMGIAAAPAVQLNGWDRLMLPAPFGRGAVVWDGPLYAPQDTDDAAAKSLAADWSARLSAATRRAEALVGRAPAAAAH
jgi:lysophospholipid acyltransferase (LPLAT)-like uncharacterized protein